MPWVKSILADTFKPINLRTPWSVTSYSVTPHSDSRCGYSISGGRINAWGYSVYSAEDYVAHLSVKSENFSKCKNKVLTSSFSDEGHGYASISLVNATTGTSVSLGSGKTTIPTNDTYYISITINAGSLGNEGEKHHIVTVNELYVDRT